MSVWPRAIAFAEKYTTKDGKVYKMGDVVRALHDAMDPFSDCTVIAFGAVSFVPNELVWWVRLGRPYCYATTICGLPEYMVSAEIFEVEAEALSNWRRTGHWYALKAVDNSPVFGTIGT